MTAFAEVRRNLRRSAERNKRCYDLGLKPKQFAVGQWVLYFTLLLRVVSDLPVRALGAVAAAPVSAAPEDNILCYDERPRHLDDVLLKSLAIGILNLAAVSLSSHARDELDGIYSHAIRSGWWANTNAARGPDSYFVRTFIYYEVVLNVQTANEHVQNLAVLMKTHDLLSSAWR